MDNNKTTQQKEETLSKALGAPVSVAGNNAWVSTALPFAKRIKLTSRLAAVSGGRAVFTNVLLPTG